MTTAIYKDAEFVWNARILARTGSEAAAAVVSRGRVDGRRGEWTADGLHLEGNAVAMPALCALY